MAKKIKEKEEKRGKEVNSPLMRRARTLLLILTSSSIRTGTRKAGILPLGAGFGGRSIARLHAQTSSKHELANSSAEATQESVEGLIVWKQLVSFKFQQLPSPSS